MLGAVQRAITWTIDDGNVVHATCAQILDTSTTTGQKQLTGVPAEIRPSAIRFCIRQTADNTTSKISFIRIDTGGTITLFNGTSAVFTAAGQCGIGDTELSWRL